MPWHGGEGNGTPLQYSCLENPMDGGAWWAAVHGVARSWTRLSDFTFTFHFHALEKEMATHSSSCLENPRDGGAWWATVSRVAQSQTRLKQLSSSSSSKQLLKGWMKPEFRVYLTVQYVSWSLELWTSFTLAVARGSWREVDLSREREGEEG